MGVATVPNKLATGLFALWLAFAVADLAMCCTRLFSCFRWLISAPRPLHNDSAAKHNQEVHGAAPVVVSFAKSCRLTKGYGAGVVG